MNAERPTPQRFPSRGQRVWRTEDRDGLRAMLRTTSAPSCDDMGMPVIGCRLVPPVVSQP